MAASSNSAAAEEAAAKAAQKRYEGLMTIRNKAVKGKGVWYWAHLEPMLVHDADTGIPKSVKLRCSLCDAVFSASNPSRTASEHLKRGSCPNFISSSLPNRPISSAVPSRKRSAPPSAQLSPSPLTVVDPSRFASESQPHLMLSGGKDDLGPLAMLEDSVKKLKSPKTSSPGPALTKPQIDAAVEHLSDWVYESCGAVSFSGLEHPKFRAFLSQVGLPPVSAREFVGGRLDVKYEEARAESEARIREAMFFQIASDGWKKKPNSLVNLTVNLPNGTSLYRRAVFLSGSPPSNYAEDVLWETVRGICRNAGQQCAGIVADRFKTKALRNLENQHHWMVNLSCQIQGFKSLIKDFAGELPLFKSVAENCVKLATFVNGQPQIRAAFRKYQLQEYGYSGLLRVPSKSADFASVFSTLDDVLCSARALQLVVSDECYKLVSSMEEPEAREVAESIRDLGFWNELEAAHSLIGLIRAMAEEIEAERPLVGQCLPLWEELRVKVRQWCEKFSISVEPVEKLVENRFRKNYHPAWSAAYVLDPLYLLRDSVGKYLPPFRYLTGEQERDVDRLITRLVSREEAHLALMELMKWRTEGLDPVYARAVQMKERDPVSGKTKLANPQSGRLVWETYLTEFKSLGKVAVRLIFLRATTSGFKCNSSLSRWICSSSSSSNGGGGSHGRQSRAALEKAEKLVFVAANLKLERRDFSSNEDKDAELFATGSAGDDVLDDVLVDASSL